MTPPPSPLEIGTQSELLPIGELLTKRERFAMAAMQGLMSMCKTTKVTSRELTEDAVKMADLLITALKSIPEPE